MNLFKRLFGKKTKKEENKKEPILLSRSTEYYKMIAQDSKSRVSQETEIMRKNIDLITETLVGASALIDFYSNENSSSSFERNENQGFDQGFGGGDFSGSGSGGSWGDNTPSDSNSDW